MPQHQPKTGASTHEEDPSDQLDSSTSFTGFIRAVFGYRKTSLTFFTVIVVFLSIAIGLYLPNLDLTIPLPSTKEEQILLDSSWSHLQKIAVSPHPYALLENDKARAYLYKEVLQLALKQPFIEVNNDTDNNILYGWNPKPETGRVLTYYESNNVLVRINGTDSSLPGLLLSAHFDLVPSADGVTDDGMGTVSLLGVLQAYSSGYFKQPKRTIIFNINNDEEAGLHGAEAFLAHPWSKQVNYFLNLEGTGAGGKAILFRGTDYGIAKFFGKVRYPFASSIFQMGFGIGYIKSETDYKVYKEFGGLRGLDVAFYKPRDIYHTLGDNIKNINQKSLWHMLSNTLDFVTAIVNDKIDLDDDKIKSIGEPVDKRFDFPVFGTLFNHFFIIPQSSMIWLNLVVLVAFPVLTLPVLIGVLCRSGWKITVVNVIKFPIAYFLSTSLLGLLSKVFSLWNEFLPNSRPLTLLFTYSAIFLLLNYVILNFMNVIFQNKKVVNHDEKLIAILELSALDWVCLVVLTGYGFDSRTDVSGMYYITALYILEASAGLLGLISWYFTPVPKKYDITVIHEGASHAEQEPLIGSSESGDFGSTTATEQQTGSNSNSSSISLTSSLLDGTRKEKKSAAYGWWLQFLIIVPISSILIFNDGYLTLTGLNKTVQESLSSEDFVYTFLQQFAITWVILIIPFVVKLNRFAVYFLIFVVLQGVYVITFHNGFDSENPLKLRFLQTVDLLSSSVGSTSTVSVQGRIGAGIEDMLKTLRAVEGSFDTLNCTDKGDGVEQCSFTASRALLQPNVIPKGSKYIHVDVIRNSLNEKIPFGLLTGEIEITAPENRICNLKFTLPDSAPNYNPVKTVIIYNEAVNNSTTRPGHYPDVKTIPKGFSKDKDGNLIYKDLDGISALKLNKLDWNKSYRVGFQWVPDFIGVEETAAVVKDKLLIDIECLWAGLSDNRVPVFLEFYAEAPNHISWANLEMGLVAATTVIEV